MSHEPERPASPQPRDRVDDPTVEEIREIRRRKWQEANQDVREYIHRAREAADRVRSKPAPELDR